MRTKTYLLHVLALALLVALVACTPSPRDAAVAFTSHENGAVIHGDRTVMLLADLTAAAPGAVITVETDALDHSETRTGDVLELEVTLKDNVNSITVSVANPGQAVPASATLELDYPYISLETHQAARTVIGQPDFDSDTEAADDRSFASPYVRPAVVDGVLYLPDYGAGRVMGYLEVPTTNGAAADFVLGKHDFDDTAADPGPATFNGPQTVEWDGQRLYVIDYSWNRILVFDTPPTASGVAADHVIGQPDFEQTGSDTEAFSFWSPESMTIANGKLIVADSGNNRVLIWNSVPTGLDSPADLVLGQPDMASTEQNAGGVAGPGTLDFPSDVWSDGTRLVVADSDNDRVLIWNSFPEENGAPADVVLGQADFAGTGGAAGASGLSYPYSVHSNGNQLFVADSDNNRVLVWNSFPSENGQAADVVLGQPDFDSAVGETSAAGLRFATGVYAYGNSLFVTDNDNRRYLVFEGANP